MAEDYEEHMVGIGQAQADVTLPASGTQIEPIGREDWRCYVDLIDAAKKVTMSPGETVSAVDPRLYRMARPVPVPATVKMAGPLRSTRRL